MTPPRIVIDATALTPLLAGSMERRAARIVEMLMQEGEYFSYFSRPSKTVTVLGMFEGHAIAVTDRGEFRRLHYVMPDPTTAQSLQLLRSEEVTIPVLSAADVVAFAEAVALEAAHAELAGDSATAAQLLEDIAPLIDPV